MNEQYEMIVSELYDMKLYDIMYPYGRNGRLEIVRVPGGWIYNQLDINNKKESSDFIPFSNEFQEQKQPKNNENNCVLNKVELKIIDDCFYTRYEGVSELKEVAKNIYLKINKLNDIVKKLKMT